MGKRKIHGQTYFQCDWTGLPMRQTNCYMPDWNESGKLLKHGSYSCWEAVIAHAAELCDGPYPTVASWARQDKIREHVNDLVGCTVHAAPHFKKLAWFAARDESDTIDSPEAFLAACCKTKEPVVAVRMLTDGTTHEVLCSQDDIAAKFAPHLTRPFNLQGPLHEPQSFQTVRKKTTKDRDLTVFYWPFKNGLPFNQTASNIFKMQIYGDALLVQQTKEACFLQRERYINYFNATYQEQFANKSKRKDHPAPTSEDYAVTKAQMASELREVEALAASSASLPGDLAKAAVLPPPSGKELADLRRAQGHAPPAKKARGLVSLPMVEATA